MGYHNKIRDGYATIWDMWNEYLNCGSSLREDTIMINLWFSVRFGCNEVFKIWEVGFISNLDYVGLVNLGLIIV